MDSNAMDAKKTVFIAEDHQLFRDGLKAMLASKDGLEVVGDRKSVV